MRNSSPPHPTGSASLDQPRRRGRDGGRVLVLNASYEPLHVCNVRRAIVLILKAKAEVVEGGQFSLHSERTKVTCPLVIRLITFVSVPRDRHSRRITRRAVFARDNWTCQYCGAATKLTVDHVIPRSKGGTSAWDNIVTSCAPCNRRKADHLPAAIGMYPRKPPTAPQPYLFIHVAAPSIPKAWRTWLPPETKPQSLRSAA